MCDYRICDQSILLQLVDIKANKKLTGGLKNLYNMMVRINGLQDKKIKDICFNVLNNNSFLYMVKIFLFQC